MSVEDTKYANADGMEMFDSNIFSNFFLYESVADFNEKELRPVEVDVEDISELLLKDDAFRESIERAREQMRAGTRGLSHEEVFGE